MRNSVVLPQPGAEQREELSCLDSEAHAVDGREVAETARHIADLESDIAK
jgi:hypothetical protein